MQLEHILSFLKHCAIANSVTYFSHVLNEPLPPLAEHKSQGLGKRLSSDCPLRSMGRMMNKICLVHAFTLSESNIFFLLFFSFKKVTHDKITLALKYLKENRNETHVVPAI